jgi:mono/diheme cytochrome c family protein/rhodanese-related sulfurtransferase/catechol 2,3-dioxygenase-like lactoylglutathione lyase family enzyme
MSSFPSSRIVKTFGLLAVLFSLFYCTSKQPVSKEAPILMGLGYGINGLALAVEDIDSAQTYFTEVLGFSLPKKDLEKSLIDQAFSSVLQFPDMSYIELVTLPDSLPKTEKNAAFRSFMKHTQGAFSYSISSSSAEQTTSWLASQNFVMDSLQSLFMTQESPSGWGRNDGGASVFSTSFLQQEYPALLPDFVQFKNFPYERMKDFISFYVMQREFLSHPNGAVGISAIQLIVKDLEQSRSKFKKMGFEEIRDNNSKNEARFRVKRHQEIQLLGTQDSNSYPEFLGDRESRILGVTVEVKNLNNTLDTLSSKLPEKAIQFDSIKQIINIPSTYAFGIQIQFKQESKDQGLLAERLKMSFGGKLDSVASSNAEAMYQKYCALCHGTDREGYAADNAPSLRSKSLLGTSMTNNFLRYTIQYGRNETAMAGYYKAAGGPLEYIEIELLLKWLNEKAEIEKPIELSGDPIKGDIELGSSIYSRVCASCHGAKGEGIVAPALGHPMLLATASDQFLRYAIAEGRDGTPMMAFKDSLSSEEIDAVTAFLRSRASGWDVPKTETVSLPTPEEYVLNPNGKQPSFKLRDGIYLSANELNEALKDSVKIVILDARSTAAWHQTHIPGAVPVPYYEDPETFVEHIPNDGTWVVAYCACPHAASGVVIQTLRRLGYKNTAILDEGILVWSQMGYPIRSGQ